MFENNSDKRQHRARMAKQFSQSNYFSRAIADEMLQRLTFIKETPKRILNCASEDGYASKKLQKLYPQAEIFSVDCLLDFLQQDTTPLKVCAEAFALPFITHSIDWIFCNQALHWEFQLEAIFQEFYRVLRPQGLLFFSMLGQDTLKEVKQSPYQFFDMHEIGDALLHHQFIDPVMDMEIMTIRFADEQQALTELSQLGFDFLQQCEALAVTMEIIYGHAWSKSQASSFKNKSGETVFPIHLLKKD